MTRTLGGDYSALAARASSMREVARSDSYQSIVARSPSSNFTRERKPNMASARLVSSFRRGWPFGLLVSHRISPEKSVAGQ